MRIRCRSAAWAGWITARRGISRPTSPPSAPAATFQTRSWWSSTRTSTPRASAPSPVICPPMICRLSPWIAAGASLGTARGSWWSIPSSSWRSPSTWWTTSAGSRRPPSIRCGSWGSRPPGVSMAARACGCLPRPRPPTRRPQRATGRSRRWGSVLRAG